MASYDDEEPKTVQEAFSSSKTKKQIKVAEEKMKSM